LDNPNTQKVSCGVSNAAIACGSKVLHPILYRRFLPGGAKIVDKKKKKYRSAEG
jgi:hypothetical protein